MKILENLGFKSVSKTERLWSWKDIFFIYIKKPSENNKHGKTKIYKDLGVYFTQDKRESILFSGYYCFDDEFSANTLLKNIGILEKINNTKILEEKTTNHEEVLKEHGFTEIEQNTWVKNIFLISLKPPRFENDRGKCIILKKPNIKKLKKADRPANIVYKGRYFFDDLLFVQILFEKIGFYLFDAGDKNKSYHFTRETLAENGNYIEEEFLKF